MYKRIYRETQSETKAWEELCHSSCAVFSPQCGSLWWGQFLFSFEVLLQYCVLGGLLQKPFFHCYHAGILPLFLTTVMERAKGGGIQKPIIRGEMFIFLLSWKGARRTKWILLLPPDLSLNKVECRRGPCTSTFCDMYKRWKGFEYFQRTRRKVCSHRPRGAMTLSLSWALCTWIDALHSSTQGFLFLLVLFCWVSCSMLET